MMIIVMTVKMIMMTMIMVLSKCPCTDIMGIACSGQANERLMKQDLNESRKN